MNDLKLKKLITELEARKQVIKQLKEASDVPKEIKALATKLKKTFGAKIETMSSNYVIITTYEVHIGSSSNSNVVTDCFTNEDAQKIVNVLNKLSIDGKSKIARDRAFIKTDERYMYPGDFE